MINFLFTVTNPMSQRCSSRQPRQRTHSQSAVPRAPVFVRIKPLGVGKIAEQRRGCRLVASFCRWNLHPHANGGISHGSNLSQNRTSNGKMGRRWPPAGRTWRKGAKEWVATNLYYISFYIVKKKRVSSRIRLRYEDIRFVGLTPQLWG